MKTGFEHAEHWLRCWGLTPDGRAIGTATGSVLFVRQGDVPLVLKISEVEEEIRGGHLMDWWNGVGAACVIECSGPAVLMDRAADENGLVDLDDEVAFPIIAKVARQLREGHQSRPKPKHLAFGKMV